MRTFSALIFSLSILLTACTEQAGSTEKGVIKGELSGVDAGASVVLKSFQKNSLVTIGKSEVDSTGRFSIEPNRPLKKAYYQLLIDNRRPVVLVTDSTESLFITAHVDEGRTYLTNSDITGSASSVKLNEYYNVIMPLQDAIDATQKRTRTASSEQKKAIEKEILDLIDQIDSITTSYVEDHKGDPCTLAALENLNPKTRGDVFKSVLADVKEELGRTTYYRMLNEKFNSVNKPRTLKNQPPPQRQKKNAKYGVGNVAPDIVMDDPNGVTRRLSDLKGKVVLIDFWASWCGPCRRENPHVVHAYNKYNSKGFEIFSVSLDSDKKRWISAIEQDGLIWPNHVSDLQGWRNQASKGYGVSSIPHTILVGTDGKIIGTHLRGSALEAELKKIFGE